MTSTLDFDVVTDEDPPPPPKREGRPGQWEALVTLADERATAAKKAKKKAPWVISAKQDAKGNRVPNVSTQAFYKLRAKYGPDSDYAKQHGYHFELILADRDGNKGNQKGVLWVRRVDG